jgi:alcohol dehydrogenase YqhD (iron-dependent ADH family)
MTEENLHKNIREIADAMKGLFERAELAYTPLVNSLIQSGSKDSWEIEHLLDGLLDFACYDRMLLLFKKLCRYYYTINPEAALSYAETCLEMWGDENEKLNATCVK